VSFPANLLVTSARALAVAVSPLHALEGQIELRNGPIRAFFTLGLLVGILLATNAPGADSPGETNAAPHFTVETFDVEGGPKISMDAVFPILSKYTGTNVSLSEIAEAAFALQAEYQKEGHPRESVAIATEKIANGIVTMNVFQAASPQIIISGVRFFSPTNPAELPAWSPPPTAAPHPAPELAATNSPPPPMPPWHPPKPATPEQLAAAAKLLMQQMARTEAEVNDHRIHVVNTNTAPGLNVQHYVISGNSILPPQTIAETLTNIDGAFGTNVSFAGVQTAVEQLQQAYYERGYETVKVGVPRQTLTNATVKLQVYEGRLANIDVVGNHYFSSNNVMRSLPSLHTNTVLNVPIFNAELGRANLNQDRQVYPLIGPGLTPGTSDLTLKVNDRPPLHGKVELNNQNSPGTPDLRVNSSAVYGNLWQNEHSVGVQYSFSPEMYKINPWPFYDEPRVANYSAFYRLPLGNPESLENQIAANPGSFGYSEATRQFNLPPPSGQPDLTLYATRATIDTGLQNLKNATLFNVPDVRVVSQQEVQEGITINEDVGFQLSQPLPEADGFLSTISGGLDYKVYSADNFQTNNFIFNEFFKSASGVFTERTTYVPSPTPPTKPEVDYLPLELNFSGNMVDFLGPATVGLHLSANLLYTSTTTYSATSTNPPAASLSGAKSLQSITGSSESTGHWVVIKPSFSQQFDLYTNWTTTVRVDGQWATEPLISTEQFGGGGVNSVRGYHEGEVFGDEGWHASVDQQTAPLVVGDVYGGAPLTVRGSIYMDFASVDLIDPNGRPGNIPLWGTGFGFSTSVGSHWQAQFLFSWSLRTAGTIQAYQPYFNFSLTGQF